MKEIFDKLSSYNIFNYLLPGILLAILSKQFTSYDFVYDDNVLLAGFFYYFIGMVISRFGSLVIEPVLKKLSFLKFASYKDFVAACAKDPKIELLSEVNNTYRTLISMIIFLLGLKVLHFVEMRFLLRMEVTYWVLMIFLLLMFLFSYRKQTGYVSKRIKANI